MRMNKNVAPWQKAIFPRSFQAGVMAAALLFYLSSPSFAQCADPVAPEGSQIYNSTHDVMQYCDGADWISMDGSVVAPAVPDDLGNHTATFNLDMGGHKVINLGTGSDPADAVTKLYVDSVTGAGETDPKIGALVNTKWCQGDADGAIQCTFDSPGLGTATGQCVARDEKTSGANGGTAAANAWTKRNLTDVVCYGLSGVSIASGSVNLPVGQYYTDVVSAYQEGLGPRTGTRLLVNGQPQYLPFTHSGPNDGQNYIRMTGLINVKTAGTVELQYYNAFGATGAMGLGEASSITGKPEIYATMYIKKISATPLPDNCSLDGVSVNHGDSRVFYSTQMHVDCAGQALSRTCNNGNLNGSTSYQYANCGADTTPDNINFTSVWDAAISTMVESNIINITGISNGVSVSINNGGQIRIGTGSWVSSGTINNGTNLQLRRTSSNTPSTTIAMTVTVGTSSMTWNVRTKPVHPGWATAVYRCSTPYGNVYFRYDGTTSTSVYYAPVGTTWSASTTDCKNSSITTIGSRQKCVFYDSTSGRWSIAFHGGAVVTEPPVSSTSQIISNGGDCDSQPLQPGVTPAICKANYTCTKL